MSSPFLLFLVVVVVAVVYGCRLIERFQRYTTDVKIHGGYESSAPLAGHLVFSKLFKALTYIFFGLNNKNTYGPGLFPNSCAGA
jgi:hypothetical protein